MLVTLTHFVISTVYLRRYTKAKNALQVNFPHETLRKAMDRDPRFKKGVKSHAKTRWYLCNAHPDAHPISKAGVIRPIQFVHLT